MKRIIYLLPFIFIGCLLNQCKKDKPKKLENPLGLLLLGSDTSLQDGKYVLRTKNGCDGLASTLRCDYIDEAIGYNGSLLATDILNHFDIDSSEIWYVKKVRYVSPDPDYALAFGYRIYQRVPSGEYRFLAFTSTASPIQWMSDEIGATYGDGGSKTVKAGTTHLDYYPVDPPVPTGFATDNDPNPKIDTRFLFQLYGVENSPGAFRIRAGGLRTTSADALSNRWNFCLGYFNNNDCEVSDIYPHFRGDNPGCEGWQEGSVKSRRCYTTDIHFQKVY